MAVGDVSTNHWMLHQWVALGSDALRFSTMSSFWRFRVDFRPHLFLLPGEMCVVPVQKKFFQPVLLRRPALARNRYRADRCFETTLDVASMRASFVLVVIGRVMLYDRTTQLLRRHAMGTNRKQVLLQHMLHWCLVLRDRPSQLLRRPMLDTDRNKVGAVHVHEYLEHNRQPHELVVLPHHRLVAQQAEVVTSPLKSLPLRQLRLCGSVGVSKNHRVVTAKAGCPWKQILELFVMTWTWV